MLKHQPGIVYESPDGGKTIYARKSGEVERTLHYIDNSTSKMLEINKQLVVWKQIVEMSLTDKDLKQELERVKMLFYLKTNGSKT